jgi:membrane protease subunit HflK
MVDSRDPTQASAGSGTPAGEVPFDAAHQSLADALRASFRVLKFIMFLLVIVFLGSGFKIINTSEEAVVLRLGKLQPIVHQPGRPLLAFPYPIDEVLVVPTKKRNTLKIMSHWFQVKKGQEMEPLSSLAAGATQGLDPVRDGALITADRGLVHVKWTLTYRIEKLDQYVLNVADGVVGTVDQLITALLENAAIRVASTYTATEFTRSKTGEIAAEIRRDVNEKLERLGTGIVVESLEPDPSVPLQTLEAFANVTRAANKKDALIREAEKKAQALLNEVAGEGHDRLIRLLDELDVAERAGDAERVATLQAEVDQALETDVSGLARSQVSQAKAFYTEAVQQIEGDVQEYHSALEEYKRQPALLINRLWESAKERILSTPGVDKIIVPQGVSELWLRIGKDPKQKEIDEIEQLKKKAGLTGDEKLDLRISR